MGVVEGPIVGENGAVYFLDFDEAAGGKCPVDVRWVGGLGVGWLLEDFADVLFPVFDAKGHDSAVDVIK